MERPASVKAAAAEARSFYLLFTRNPASLDKLRVDIAVPPILEGKLRVFAGIDPDGAEFARAIHFRRLVLEEFDRLVAAGIKVCPTESVPVGLVDLVEALSVTSQTSA